MDKSYGEGLIDNVKRWHPSDWSDVTPLIKENRKKLTRDQINELERLGKWLYRKEESQGGML